MKKGAAKRVTPSPLITKPWPVKVRPSNYDAERNPDSLDCGCRCIFAAHEGRGGACLKCDECEKFSPAAATL